MTGPTGVPGPDNATLAGYFATMITKDTEEIDRHLVELSDTVVDTETKAEPIEFAYAKMVNYFGSDDITVPELVHLCAAAIWKLHGQENAQIYVLKADEEVISVRRETD